MTATFGSFNLSDNVSYHVTERSFNYPDVKETLFKVARFDGVKKTGQTINERVIPLTIRVVGASRSDFESKLDALYLALSQQQQHLSLHNLDNRYFVADAISATTRLSVGSILSADVAVSFLCQIPYAYASAPLTFTTGATLLTLVSGTTYTFPGLNITGSGTVYSYPVIRLTENTTNTAWTAYNIQQTTDGITLSGTTGMPTVVGDYLEVNCDPGLLSTGWTVTKNGLPTIYAFVGEPPVMEPGVTTWVITVSAPVQPTATALFTWTPRYLT